MEFLVGKSHDGVLLRSYLKGTCAVSSRLLIQLKKRPDGILVNGEHATVRRTLHTGDRVMIAEQDAVSQDVFEPVDLPFQILFEDEDLLIVDKPPYMPTHPSAGHHGDTLANALTWLFAKRNQPFVFRPVSRLDRNTSGVLTLAKNQYAAARLCEAMLQRQIQKTYYAITDGLPPNREGRLETGTRRAQEFFVLREVCDPAEQEASLTITEYRVCKQWNRHALVELHPLTGRTHQLRVHLAALGCPILGDDLYGRASSRIGRHALHAACVQLMHPRTGQSLAISAPFPPDFHALLQSLEKDV